MDQLTHDVGRANLLNIITKCQQSCEQIQLPAVTARAEVSFAEFILPSSAPVKLTAANNAVAAIRTNGVTQEI